MASINTIRQCGNFKTLLIADCTNPRRIPRSRLAVSWMLRVPIIRWVLKMLLTWPRRKSLSLLSLNLSSLSISTALTFVTKTANSLSLMIMVMAVLKTILNLSIWNLRKPHLMPVSICPVLTGWRLKMAKWLMLTLLNILYLSPEWKQHLPSTNSTSVLPKMTNSELMPMFQNTSVKSPRNMSSKKAKWRMKR